MSDLNYSVATWRIQVWRGVFIEVNVRGCLTDNATASPEDLLRAGQIMRDLSRAIIRVRDRWAIVKAA